MNALQREYLLNARKAIRIADAVKFNAFAYQTQSEWASAYWHNYLKSTQARNFREQVERLKEFLERKDTTGALRYIGGH